MRGVVRSLRVGLLVSTLAMSPALSAEPSFDCRKALTGIENFICSDDHLAEQDKRLSSLYSKISHPSESRAADLIVREQRDWIKDRNSYCSNQNPVDTRTCLDKSYRSQLFVLDSIASAEASGDPIILFEGKLRTASRDDPKEGPQEFNRAFHTMKSGDHVTSCSIMASFELTRYETGIGGLCILKSARGKTRNVLICDDTAVGNFKQIDEGPTPAKLYDVAQFVANHCTGG